MKTNNVQCFLFFITQMQCSVVHCSIISKQVIPLLDAGTAPQVLTYSEMVIKNIQDIQHKTQRLGHEENTFFLCMRMGIVLQGSLQTHPNFQLPLTPPPLPALNFNKLDL